ncbi:MAG: hypothetical protein Q8O41_10355 [Candidatus Methanoperedens sp.]|nr:hypothetical protein [Candidatus Methanoperedens sp.]
MNNVRISTAGAHPAIFVLAALVLAGMAGMGEAATGIVGERQDRILFWR